jgi:Domain of unknown function (DUF5666)
MSRITRRAAGALGLAFILAASASFAQAPPVRVRGTIAKVDGQTLMVKSREGADVTVKLADNGVVIAIVKAALSDVKPGSFVGVTALPEQDGSWRAVEVHIFPESMRGTGEGDRSHDLMPKSTMTNATVDQTVKAVDGQVLTLKFKGGEKKIVVTADTVIVTYTPGDKSELKPGANIAIAAATKKPDGTYEAARVNVGRGDFVP